MKNIKNLKIGIMAIGDYCDSQVTYALKTCELTSNVKKITDFVKTVPNTGGGDEPECYELALYEAARNVKWSPKESIAKALVVIGDAPPHPPQYTKEKIDWKKELSTLVKKDIKIYGVVCNSRSQSRPFYEIIAKKSGCLCIDFTQFSLMTKMFLAICLRESSKEKLQEFKSKLAEEDGGISGELGNIISALEQENPEKEVDEEEEDVKREDKKEEEKLVEKKSIYDQYNHLEYVNYKLGSQTALYKLDITGKWVPVDSNPIFLTLSSIPKKKIFHAFIFFITFFIHKSSKTRK